MENSLKSRTTEHLEPIFVRLFLLIVAFLTLFDIIEDYAEGADLTHLLTEAFLVVSSLALAVMLWRRAIEKERTEKAALVQELGRVRAAAADWREKNRSLSEGLSRAISAQLNDWRLSEAETEIALLLLKGLSLKEISYIRQTSERTVRQQATHVYQKANLEGRAELSAFFLEDLLSLPASPSRPENTPVPRS